MFYQLIGLAGLLAMTGNMWSNKGISYGLIWAGLTLIYAALYANDMYNKGHDRASEY